MENLTSDFILLGFSDLHYNPVSLFCVFLTIYVLMWVGNILLLSAIQLAPQLHTPMYFFLGNLSIVDICFCTVTVPKLLSSVLHGMTTISFLGCFLQMFFFLSVGNTENLLLAVMAFDRYLAICSPLHYNLVMKKKVCVMLVSGCWVTASLHSVLHSYTTSSLTYCEDRLIHHFFCDLTPLLMLSCSSTSTNELLIYTEGTMAIMLPLLFILASYILIGRAISRLKTNTSRSKAFSSCSSHLTIICLFYGTVIFTYFRPSSGYSPSYDRLVSIVFTMLTPTLNPYIYSLRNKEVKIALKKTILLMF